MKDAFQKEHEGEDENDWTIGPGGKKVLTPEAAQRKVVKDRAVSEEVSSILAYGADEAESKTTKSTSGQIGREPKEQAGDFHRGS